ncbi:MAG: hypothetical protein LBP50_10570 [Tannerella sp.]|jgi:hypothetical protein|nr:hypothetical protein [Tannerella sp.]
MFIFKFLYCAFRRIVGLFCTPLIAVPGLIGLIFGGETGMVKLLDLVLNSKFFRWTLLYREEED